MGLLLLLSMCALVLAAHESVLLSSVSTLVLKAGQMTTGRRSAPVPQLQCVGGECADDAARPRVIMCQNKGSDGRDAVWACTAELPSSYKLGTTDVSCEGFLSPDDPFILVGSCGVEYTVHKVAPPPAPVRAQEMAPPPPPPTPAPVWVHKVAPPPPPPAPVRAQEENHYAPIDVIVVCILGAMVFVAIAACICGCAASAGAAVHVAQRPVPSVVQQPAPVYVTQRPVPSVAPVYVAPQQAPVYVAPPHTYSTSYSSDGDYLSGFVAGTVLSSATSSSSSSSRRQRSPSPPKQQKVETTTGYGTTKRR